MTKKTKISETSIDEQIGRGTVASDQFITDKLAVSNDVQRVVVSSSQQGRAKNFSFALSLWLGIALSVLVFGGGSVHAVQITVGNVQITDNGANDLDLALNAIEFDSGAPAPAGFALPAGSSVSTVVGQVNLVGGLGGLVQILGAPAQILSLTNFVATKLVPGAAGALMVSFDHTFQVPNVNQIRAAESIGGDFQNFRPGVGVFGDTVTFQGFVNNAGISPAGITVSTPAVAPGVPQMSIGQSTFPAQFAGGPPWTLRGDLTVKLGALGNQLDLPNSVEVGISETVFPVPKTVKKFPYGIALALAVIAFLVVLAFLRWRRSSAT